MSPKPSTVELPPDLVAKIDQMAARAGVTREDAIRQLLHVRLEEDTKYRVTLDGSTDVDAGRVVSHESVQVLAASAAEHDLRSEMPAGGKTKGAKPKHRGKRPRLPRGWAQGMKIAPPEPKEPPKRRRKDDGPIVVTDDWPELVPIGDDELRVIEGYMRRELDELFGLLP